MWPKVRTYQPMFCFAVLQNLDYPDRRICRRDISKHDRLTWHGKVFQGHGTKLGGKRTHPVSIDTTDPRRSCLHVRYGLSTNAPWKQLSSADALLVRDSCALPSGKNYHRSSWIVTISLNNFLHLPLINFFQMASVRV